MAQLVEYDLAKVGVAGSSPVSRSLLEVFFKTSFLLYVKQHTFLNSKITNPAHTGKDILYAHVSSNDKSL